MPRVPGGRVVGLREQARRVDAGVGDEPGAQQVVERAEQAQPGRRADHPRGVAVQDVGGARRTAPEQGDEHADEVELLLGQVDVRPAVQRAVRSEEVLEHGPVLLAQHDAGLDLLGRRPGPDPHVGDAGHGHLDRDVHARVGEDVGGPADQLLALGARLVAGDLHHLDRGPGLGVGVEVGMHPAHDPAVRGGPPATFPPRGPVVRAQPCWARRNLPKWGTVKATVPRSEE